MSKTRLRASAAAVFFCASATGGIADTNDLLASADPALGESQFRKCASCHTTDNGGANRVGPNLYGIVGGNVAAKDGYRYSSALTEYAGVWSTDRLNAFLESPRNEVRGTKMGFAGIRNEADRANLIAYLNTFSDAPVSFGATPVAAEADAEQNSTESETPEFGILKVADGVEETYYACTACHSEMIVAQQGLDRHGWEKMLEWMVEEQGMIEYEGEEKEAILNYLTTHYNVDRPNFPQR